MKLFAAILIFALDWFCDLIRSMLGNSAVRETVALYYHQVRSEDRARFAWQMDHLLRCASPVRIADLDSDPNGARRVAITADDIWLSFVENALPELEKRNIPATFFVISDRLGESLGDPYDRLISESELLRLPSNLVTIGSHTATHCYLTTASEDKIRWELSYSRTHLSRLLNTDVSLFCFPYSAYDQKTVRLCREVGYTRAFGAPSIRMPELPDSYLVQRVRVDPTDWQIEFHLKMMNAYRGVLILATLKSKLQALGGMRAAQTPSGLS